MTAVRRGLALAALIASDSATSAARSWRSNAGRRHDLVECQTTPAFAAADLFARAEPREHRAAKPARSLIPLAHDRAGAGHFLFVHEVRGGHRGSQQRRARPDLDRW